jgi:hypothetical protein
MAVAHWRTDRNGQPRRTGPHEVWDTAAGRHPEEAVLRLCARAIDSGRCRHCGKLGLFEPDVPQGATPMDPLVCIYSWDPELSTFRRGCEGDDR